MNQTPPKPSLISEVLGQFSDLFDLAILESRFEIADSSRRFAAFAAAFVLVLTAFALLQITLVDGLMRFGLSMGIASLILAVIYGIVAWVLISKFGHRDKKVGVPFEATQREIKESLRWIQKIF